MDIVSDIRSKIQSFKLIRNTTDKKVDELKEFNVDRDLLENYRKSIFNIFIYF